MRNTYWGLAFILLFVNLAIAQTPPVRVSIHAPESLSPYSAGITDQIRQPAQAMTDTPLTPDQEHPEIDVSLEWQRADIRMVVLDTAHGVRLWDSVLLQQNAHNVIAEAVANTRSAASKHNRAQSGQVVFISLLPPVIADLGENAATVCRAALPLLEQRLTWAKEIALLDRPRLVEVQATSRPTKDPVAPKSWRISIEFSRGATDESTNAAIVMKGPDGQMKRATFASPLNAASISRNCYRAILEQLLTRAIPAATGDQVRTAEVVELIDQIRKRAKQHDFEQAADIASSAYALSPTDREVRLLHAQMLIMAGASKVCAGTYARNAGQIDMLISGTAKDDFSDRMDAALKLIRQGVEALLDVPPLDEQIEPGLDDTFSALRQFLANLRRDRFGDGLSSPPMLRLTPSQTKQLDCINDAFRKYRLDLELPPIRDNAQEHFDAYTKTVSSILCDSRYLWTTTGDQWTSEWTAIVDDWGEAAAKHYGGKWVRGMNNIGRPITGSKSPMRWGGPQGSVRLPDALREASTQMGSIVYAFSQLEPLHDMRQPNYEQLANIYESLRQLPWADADHLCLVWRDTMANISGNTSPGFFRPRPRRLPEVELTGLIAPSPPAVGPGSPWPDSLVLFDVTRQLDLPPCLGCPLVDRDHRTVYVIGLEPLNANGRQDSKTSQLSLIRRALAGGPAKVVNKLIVPWRDVIFDRNRTSMYDYFADRKCSAQLCGAPYIYCDPNRGVVVCPIDGGATYVLSHETADLPAGPFTAAAILDHTLYFALGTPGQDGYLMARDPSSQSIKTLVSNRRALDPKSPLDSQAPVSIRAILADEPRNRIVFLAVAEIGHQEVSGWWAYEPASASFARLGGISELRANTQLDEVWATRSDDNTVAFGIPYSPARSLHLAANQLTDLPAIPVVAGSNGISDAALQTPLVVHDNYIWGRFGRYPFAPPADGSSGLETFVPLRFQDAGCGAWPLYLQPAGNGAVIAGDGAVIYLLRVPSDATALAKATMPPQPVGSAIELIDDPPIAGNLPWNSVTTVFDATRQPTKVSALIHPILRGHDLYAMANLNAQAEQLVRISLDDQTCHYLGATREIRSPSFNTRVDRISLNAISAAAIDLDNYYYSESDTVYVHPLAEKPGAPVTSFKFTLPLPCSFIVDMAVVDGQLFAIVKNYRDDISDLRYHLLRRDLVTGQQTDITPTFPAPTTVQASAPEGIPPFAFHCLSADPARKRILFLAHQHGDSASLDGLWACTTTGKPELLKRLTLRPAGEAMPNCPCGMPTWSGNVTNDHLLVIIPTATFDIDVKTLQTRTITTAPDMAANLDPAAKPGANQPCLADAQLTGPIAWQDDWIWHGRFGRLDANSSTLQKFPLLRPMNMREREWSVRLLEYWPDTRSMVVVDSCAVWILHLTPPRTTDIVSP